MAESSYEIRNNGSRDETKEEVREGELSVCEAVQSEAPVITQQEIREALLLCQQAIEAISQDQWWENPNFRELPPSSLLSANVCLKWEEERNVVGETRILSEYKVIRELLWALERPNNYYIFKKRNEKYVPMEKVSVCSLTPESFHATILEICPFLSIIESLNSFVEEIQTSRKNIYSLSNTYIAYAYALGDILSDYRQILSEIEAKVCKQENIHLVTGVTSEVIPWLLHLKFLYSVHKRAVFKDWKNHETWKCSIRLLAVLYDNLSNCDRWNKTSLLVIFLKSLYPYIDILEKWINKSNSFDFKNEFIIARPSRNICEGHLLIREYRSVLDEIGLKNINFFDSFVYFSVRACSSIDFLTILQNDIELKHKVNMYEEYLKLILDDINIFDDSQSSKFMYNSIPEYYLNKCECEDTGSKEKVENSSVNSNKYVGSYSEFKKKIKNPNMKILFGQMLVQQNNQKKSNANKIFEKIQTLSVSDLFIQRVLNKHFTSVISQFMQPNGFAKHALLVDLKLLDHLSILQMVYLFQNGSFMNEFAKKIFKELTGNRVVSVNWTKKLREAIYEINPTYFLNFSVSISSNDVFNNFNIIYQRCPPLNLVITDCAIQKFIELFHFLLKLKWACTNSTSMKIQELAKEDHCIGRLYSCRIFLFHTLLSLQKYFLQSISYFYSNFMDEIIHLCSSCRDIHHISSAIENMLEKLKVSCFLDGAAGCNEHVNKIFILCDEFMCLCKIKEGISSSSLSKIELSYQEAVFELTEGLSILGSTMAFKSPFFESFCDEIMSNMPGNWDRSSLE